MDDSSASSSRGPASFATQANALLRKNISFQKRNIGSNLRLVCYPIFLCILLIVIQMIVDKELDKPKNKCGCRCVDTNGDGVCENVCGIQYSTLDQVFTCAIPNPPEFPPFLQVPRPEYRAARTGSQSFADLPQDSCRETGNCPATTLITGGNQTLAEGVAQGFFTSSFIANAPALFSMPSIPETSNLLSALSKFSLGTDARTRLVNFIEPAILSNRPVYTLQKQQCTPNSKVSVPLPILDGIPPINIDVECVQGAVDWRNSSALVNDELYKGYRQSNTDNSINEIMTAFDFLDSDNSKFNLNVWYNSSYKNDSGWGSPIALARVPPSVNLVSNAYLKHIRGPGIGVQFEFTKEMPKPANRLELDFSSLLGPLFFKWVVELLFPVLLTYLVYEKQHKLRIMMKMHGLGDGPYWIISYGYFLLISCVYVLFLVVFGSLIGLKFFTKNDYSIQFVFHFTFINLQIALAFLLATGLSNVKIAQAIAYIYVFGSGLLAEYLFRAFVEDLTFSRNWVRVMEVIPAFALYRGMYEFGTYSFNGRFMGTSGMRWKDLNNSSNGMKEVLIIVIVEWLMLLAVAYYIDQLSSFGVQKNPLHFLPYFQEKKVLSSRKSGLERQGSKVFVEIEKPDVIQEREVVEQLLLESNPTHAIISDNLKKVYPGRDGNNDKLAVQGLSLAVPRGECFGVLGPNGAGKTTFIHMMIGLVAPTSGNAYVQGFSIQTEMNKIYTSMGVCPQHDMLWETLSGREHLLFYGRLKNLKGQALTQAVEESLKSVNLFHGGVADKQAGKYSGGMKRRLSVAISLIGDPKVVYMDEPSTGLDPASRNNLWNVVKKAKQNRAIILTTHSMEEAEVLCDRLGIFASGGLQCIGNPKQLKGRYGGTYLFTMTTNPDDELEVENLVNQLSPNANKIYHISGTQKFEIPKQDVKIADVFEAVELAKRKFPVQAWGLTDTTLEDVFIKVAKGADSLSTLS